MPDPLPDLARCALHTFTTKPLSLAEAIDAYTDAGIPALSIWRQHLDPLGIDAAAKLVRGSGLTVPAYVRGGFFPAFDAADRDAALDDNRRYLDEAAALGADQIVLVVGAVPGMPLAEARAQVRDGIAACLPKAEEVGVKLSIEPLHPMYAADKSCVNSMRAARRIWEELDHPLLGVAVDVYHVWFDEDLADEIGRAGTAGKIFGFHVCDWKVDTAHLLLDRGLMGEGCIDVPGIRGLVEDAGFSGWIEVEIFSETHWAKNQRAWIDEIAAAYLAST